MERMPDGGDKKKPKWSLGKTMQAAAIALTAMGTPSDTHEVRVSETTAERAIASEQMLETLVKKRDPWALPYVALLAYGLSPDLPKLQNDPGLWRVGDVDPALVAPLVSNRRVDAAYWDLLSRKVLLAPALNTDSHQVQFLKEVSEQYADIDPIELGQAMGLVARNIAFRHRAASIGADYGDYSSGDDYGGYSYVEEDTFVAPTPTAGSPIENAAPSIAKNSLPEAPTPQLKAQHNSEPREVNADAVRAEVASILERREGVASLDLFRDRDVLLLSNNQSSDPFQKFGTPEFERALKARVEHGSQSDRTFTQIKPLARVSREEALTAKSDALSRVREGTHPLTVFFDGHGLPNQWFFTSNSIDGNMDPEKGELARDVSISSLELAATIAERWAAQQTVDPDAREVNIALIFNSCESQDYIRNVADELKARGIPLPQLLITSSEFGQYSFSDDQEYGSRFNKLILDSPTVGSVMKAKSSLPNETPTIFVPRKDDPHTLMQLSGIVLPSGSTSAIG